MGQQYDATSATTSTAKLNQQFTIGNTLDELENRAVWLDQEFRIPMTDVRIGVSSIVGFVPGVGDGLMLLMAASIVYHGMRIGAPTRTLIWMFIVLLVEGIIGFIPIVGDAVGILWSANIQNVGYLRANQETLDGSTNWVFVLFLCSPAILFVLMLVAPVILL